MQMRTLKMQEQVENKKAKRGRIHVTSLPRKQ